MNVRFVLFLQFICLMIFISSCKNESGSSSGAYDHGVLITNEGQFNTNTGSVSFYNPATNKIYNDIFGTANGRSLGDVVQSFSAFDDKGFIIVNNSQKVEVVLLKNFKSLGIIQASYPRHFIPVGSGKAYLTNGYFPGQVYVINTTSLAITDTITVGNQPENLLLHGSKVYVANGNWGNDTTISEIDVFSDKLIKTIPIGDGPANLVSVSDSIICVLCMGKQIYDGSNIVLETNSKLVEYNVTKDNVSFSKIIGQIGDLCRPYLLAADNSGNVFYVEADGVHKLANSILHEDNLLIPYDNSSGVAIYGMSVDPVNSNIYLLETNGFASAGNFQVYSSTGNLLETFTVGIAPNGAVRY